MSRYTSGDAAYGEPSQPVYQQAIDQLNSLLRGELSATETYRQAFDSVKDSDKITAENLSEIREIHMEHSSAAEMLRQRVLDLGGSPADSSGIRGAWAKIVQGTMSLFGDTSSLKSLKEGEEHALKDYEDALDDVDPDSRRMIAEELIPAQQRHISLLTRLINVVSNTDV